jgi:hypothetical protein
MTAASTESGDLKRAALAPGVLVDVAEPRRERGRMRGLGGNFFKNVLYFCSALGLEAIGFELRQFTSVHVVPPTKEEADHLAGLWRRQSARARAGEN